MIHTEWPRRRGDVLTEYLPDGSAFLYDPNTEMVYPLTVTAAIVWEVCDGTHGSVAMVNELGDSFDAPPDVIEQDVRAVLERFGEIGLLESSARVGP